MNDLYPVAGPWPGRVGILPRPRGGDWLEDEVRSWKRLGIDIVVSLLTPQEMAELELVDEQKFCSANGIEFLSLPVPDRGVPPSQEAVLSVVRRLDARMAAGKSVGIHCRQGIGRSGILAACLLVSTGVSPQGAFTQLIEARGRSVPDTSEQREWVEEIAHELMQ